MHDQEPPAPDGVDERFGFILMDKENGGHTCFGIKLKYVCSPSSNTLTGACVLLPANVYCQFQPAGSMPASLPARPLIRASWRLRSRWTLTRIRSASSSG